METSSAEVTVSGPAIAKWLADKRIGRVATGVYLLDSRAGRIAFLPVLEVSFPDPESEATFVVGAEAMGDADLDDAMQVAEAAIGAVNAALDTARPRKVSVAVVIR